MGRMDQNMNKKLIISITLCFPILTHASFFGVSDHSRANCINNESITWDATKVRTLSVVSFHMADYLNRMGQYNKHRLQTGWENTRRSAAVHWGEGYTPTGYYLVQGWHWEGIDGVGEVLRATTSVDNCSIYNGWWEL